MTALKEYERLEASGLWRAAPDDQRREVVVSIGDATLVITDMKDQPLTHWSLAAVVRRNPGEVPAIYSPDGDPGETLELAEGETTMVEAIDRLHRAIARARPHPGRLRNLIIGGLSAAILLLVVLWLPGAMLRHTVSVVPEIKRDAIGAALLGRIERVSGRACTAPGTSDALQTLARRTGADRVVVLPAGVRDSQHLPGGIVLLNKALIEDHEDPAVAAGHIVEEQVRNQQSDGLTDLLRHGGLVASFRLITTGELSDPVLDAYAEHVLTDARDRVPDDLLLDGFASAQLPSTPYAYSRDVTGETVLGLIEADPMANRDTPPILSDSDWVRLQGICGG